MSEAAAAKYLSKVKGHNEKTHEKLRRSIPKLGVEEEDVNDAYDAIDEDSEEDGHNIRHENVAKVVEAAEMQNEASGSGIPREAALGRKQSERRGLQPATTRRIATRWRVEKSVQQSLPRKPRGTKRQGSKSLVRTSNSF